MKKLLTWLLSFYLYDVFVGRHVVYKGSPGFPGDVCVVENVDVECGTWTGKWVSGDKTNTTFTLSLSKTFKRDWKPLLYGLGRGCEFEIARPYCTECGRFLGNIAGPGDLREVPCEGWFCVKHW